MKRKTPIPAPATPLWQLQIITLFPELFPGPLAASLAGKALEAGAWSLSTINLRDYATDKHRSVDDTPYGGGAGMVLRADIVGAALSQAQQQSAGPIFYLSPRGRVFNQSIAAELAQGSGATLLCGRFEGVDQRVLDAFSVTELSVGDFVLAGGELAAMIVAEAVIRLLPGVMGNADTAGDESFSNGLLEYPHYTRPANWQAPDGRIHHVPDILLSGNHEKIRAWRKAEAENLTRQRRPDLWHNYLEQRRK